MNDKLINNKGCGKGQSSFLFDTPLSITIPKPTGDSMNKLCFGFRGSVPKNDEEFFASLLLPVDKTTAEINQATELDKYPYIGLTSLGAIAIFDAMPQPEDPEADHVTYSALNPVYAFDTEQYYEVAIEVYADTAYLLINDNVFAQKSIEADVAVAIKGIMINKAVDGEGNDAVTSYLPTTDLISFCGAIRTVDGVDETLLTPMTDGALQVGSSYSPENTLKCIDLSEAL